MRNQIHSGRLVGVVFMALFIGSISCATGPQADPFDKSGSQLAGREGVDFRELQYLFSHGAYDSLQKKLITFEKKYPQSPQIAQVRNIHGLTYLAEKKPVQAVFQFKKAIEASTSSTFTQFVLYSLATAQFEANQIEDTQQTLADIKPDRLDKDTRIKFHSLQIRVFQRNNAHPEVVREALVLSRLVSTPETNEPLVSAIQESLKNVSDLTILGNLYREFEDAPMADLVLFRLGAQELASGQTSAGEAHLRSLLTRYPKTIHYAEATDLLGTTPGQTATEPKAIGVLLPMKGKFARFGTQSLQGIQLAFNIFNSDEPDSKITLVIEDSGDDGEQAVKALNNLYFKHHVVAVIGPLLSKGIDSVTQRAQALGLPILPLAQQPGVAGDYVFPAGLTLKSQAQEIARYAIEQLGLRRFAILHPRDKFGEQYSQNYWDAVESLGGKVVGVESYNPGETDFRQPIDRLSGLYYTEARQRELDELAKQRELNNIKKKNRKTEQYYNLTPIVDYEAVFIPDDAKVAGQILPTFAYRDVDHVRFLGTSSWNSPDFILRAQNSAEGAIFLDSFFAESTSPQVKKFNSRFEATFGQPPGTMEAIAFDAASVLHYIVTNSSPKTRAEARDELKAIRNFSGVTGKLTYRDGQFARTLTILTVRNGKTEAANATP